MKKTYEDKGIKLVKGDFDFESISNVSLWNMAPVWPGRKKSRLSVTDLSGIVEKCYNLSRPSAYMVLWIPASELHQTLFDPQECSPWLCQGTILSGSHPMHIGYVHTRGGASLSHPTRLILDERGKRASSSSKAMKYLLEELLSYGQHLVADPFGHRSAVLPIWCRRLHHRYVGAVRSKASYIEMANRLAQEELPGIQLEIPIKGRG